MDDMTDRLIELSGKNPAECYRCGKCTAGCPMAFAMDILPHQVMHFLATDRIDKVLNSRTIWTCVSCETCSARCPQLMPVAETMDAIRQMAIEKGIKPTDRNVAAFHRHFLAQIRKHGRVNEFPLAIRYKMSTGTFFSDAMSAPFMFLKGKLKPIPRSGSPQARNVRKIFQRCLP